MSGTGKETVSPTKLLGWMQLFPTLREMVHHIERIEALLASFIKKTSLSRNAKSNSASQNGHQRLCWRSKVGLPKQTGPRTDTCMETMRVTWDSSLRKMSPYKITYVTVHENFPFQMQQIFRVLQFRWIILNNPKEMKNGLYHLLLKFREGRRNHLLSLMQHFW